MTELRLGAKVNVSIPRMRTRTGGLITGITTTGTLRRDQRGGGNGPGRLNRRQEHVRPADRERHRDLTPDATTPSRRVSGKGIVCVCVALTGSGSAGPNRTSRTRPVTSSEALILRQRATARTRHRGRKARSPFFFGPARSIPMTPGSVVGRGAGDGALNVAAVEAAVPAEGADRAELACPFPSAHRLGVDPEPGGDLPAGQKLVRSLICRHPGGSPQRHNHYK